MKGRKRLLFTFYTLIKTKPKTYDMNISYEILKSLSKEMNMNEIAKTINYEKGSILLCKRLRILEENKLIERTTNKRRYNLYKITNIGTALLIGRNFEEKGFKFLEKANNIYNELDKVEI